MDNLFLTCLLSTLLCVSAHQGGKDVLSDAEHTKEGVHNAEFDHQAFLGKDEAEVFDKLSPEESKKRLGKLFHLVDKDSDGFASKVELNNWIKQSHDRYIHADSLKQLNANDLNKDSFVTWEEYMNATYGFLEEHKSEIKEYEKMLTKEEKRFKLADKEGDGKLNIVEWSAFLHPDDFDHMKGIKATETLNDIDANKDGSISLEEYINDVYPVEGRKATEPSWVESERKQFREIHDKNGDGKMDAGEVNGWINPPNYDHFAEEAEHLVSESDRNRDGKVSKEEMLTKHDLYAGSQATRYGEILKEEL